MHIIIDKMSDVVKNPKNLELPINSGIGWKKADPTLISQISHLEMLNQQGDYEFPI